MQAQNGSKNLTALGRHPERGHYDFETIAGILDAGQICHLGVTAGDWPIVMPTTYGRIGKNLYVHGSPVARWLKNAASGAPICITVSILDALVLARSAYQHSLNYRSVVILDAPVTVEGETEKRDALRAIVEHVCPGRWNDVRLPTSGELKSTLVLRVPVVAASAKIRTGPPVDFDFDMQHSAWAGLIPLQTVRGAPVADPLLSAGIPVPAYCLQETNVQRTSPLDA